MLTTVTARFRDNIQFLLKHQGFRRYGANTLWLFAEKILRLTVGFFVGVWVARYLGPEKYGLLSYAQAFVFLFSAIANLGLDGIVVRELVKGTYKEEEILGSAFFLKLIGSITAFILIAIVSGFIADSSYERLLILIIALSLIFQSFNVIDMYFQSKVLSKYVVFANMISLFMNSLVKITLILNNAPLETFVVVVVFDSFVLALGYVYFFIKNFKFKIQNLKFSKSIAISLLKDSWPLIVSFFSTSLTLQSTQIVLKNLLDNTPVGYYVVAIKLISLFFFIPIVISQSFFPSLISSNEKYIQKRKIISSFLIILGLLTCFLIFITSKLLILTLYGTAYFSSIKILQILSPSLVFIFFVSLRKKLLLVERKTKIILYYSVSSGITMVITSYFFVEKFGLIGAPIAYTLTWGLSVMLIPIFFKRFVEIKLFFQSFNFINIIKLNVKGVKIE